MKSIGGRLLLAVVIIALLGGCYIYTNEPLPQPAVIVVPAGQAPAPTPTPAPQQPPAPVGPPAGAVSAPQS